jgi:hypothetical protein
MFLHGYQVLNFPEGHHSLDPILWASILEDSKLSGVLGIQGWIVWIHEKLLLNQLRIFRMGPSIFSIFFIMETNGMGGGKFLRTEGGKEVEALKSLVIAIFLM